MFILTCAALTSSSTPVSSRGFGYTLLEALACGAAVVATDCPYGPREVLGGEYGVLTPSDDLAGAGNGGVAAVGGFHRSASLGGAWFEKEQNSYLFRKWSARMKPSFLQLASS